MLLPALLLLAQGQDPAASLALVELAFQEPAEIPRHIQIYEVASLLADPWSALPSSDAEGDPFAVDRVEPQVDFWAAEVAKSETWSGYGDAAHPYATADELMRTLGAFMWPRLNARVETLQLDKGYLVAHLRKDQHAWLAAFLGRLRGPHTWQGRVDAHFIRLPQGGASKLGLERSATTLSGRAETDAFLAKIEKVEHDVLASPSLMAGMAQRARMSILNQVAYVKDFELKVVQPGNVEIADPVVAVVHEGKILDLRIVDVGEGLYGMELKSTIAQLQRPIPTHKIRLGPGEGTEVEVGLPEVITAAIDAELRMASGDSVVLFSPSADEFDLLIIVSFQVIQLPPIMMPRKVIDGAVSVPKPDPVERNR